MKASPAARGPNRRQALTGLAWAAAASTAMLAWPVHATAQGQGNAVPPEVAAEVPGARQQGGDLFRYFGFRVYDIRLWVGERAVDQTWDDRPLALALTYQRKLVGAQIAERSLKEMQGLATVSAADAERWLLAMKRLFPDVAEGDRLTGVLRPGQGARFFLNGQLRGDVDEPEFARLFFGIWLAPGSSEPALRNALLGRQR
jgi:hypothetical protein